MVGYDLLGSLGSLGRKSTRPNGSIDMPLRHLVVQDMPGHSQGMQEAGTCMWA